MLNLKIHQILSKNICLKSKNPTQKLMFYVIGCHKLFFNLAQIIQVHLYSHEYIMLLKIRDTKISTLRKNGMLDMYKTTNILSNRMIF